MSSPEEGEGEEEIETETSDDDIESERSDEIEGKGIDEIEGEELDEIEGERTGKIGDKGVKTYIPVSSKQTFLHGSEYEILEDLDEYTVVTGEENLVDEMRLDEITKIKIPSELEIFDKSELSLFSLIDEILLVDGKEVGQICKYNTVNITFPSSNNLPEYDPSEFCKDIQKDRYSPADYSNKMIILNNEFIEVVKKRMEFDEEEIIFYIVNKSDAKEIERNEFHLDNLQYSLAKAMGIQPDQIKLTYLLSKSAPVKKGYVKVNLKKNLILTDSLKPDVERIYEVKCIKNVLDDSEHVRKEVRINVHNFSYGTKWLGGYRNKDTDVYYHNASTQTDPRRKDFNKPPWEYLIQLITRDTQTKNPSRDFGINPSVDHSTQMWRPDYYIQSCTDKIISTGIYKPFIINEKLKEKAAIIIQKHWRGYLSRKLIGLDYVIKESNRLKQFKNMLLEDCILHGEFMDKDKNNVQMLDMIYPQNRKDFYTLHWLLKKFKTKNMKELKNIKQESTRQAKLYQFLEKEMIHLNSIHQQTDRTAKELAKLKYKKDIEISTLPLIKENVTKHCLYLIEKSGVERSRELKELFVLFRKNVLPEQRVEIILLFKQLIQYYDEFDMKDDLIELFNRECILLYSGVPDVFLQGIRKRIEEIIFHFLTTKANKEELKKSFTKEIIRCKYCKKFKYIREFPLHLRQNKVNVCRVCQFLYDQLYAKNNLAPCQDILNDILIHEFMNGSVNPYASILGPHDIYHLIQTIWKGRSIISDVSITNQLRLPRWDRKHPWAPWNCILLTMKEAKHHQLIDNVYEFYAKQFCNLIHYKHVKTILEFPALIDIESKTRDYWTKLSNKQLYERKLSFFESFNRKGNDKFFTPPPIKKL